jgi:hypothetical protein
MESVLIIVTLVSLALTLVLGGILARLMRDERRRSAARVAVLREMADATARQQEAIEPDWPELVRQTPVIENTTDLFVRREPRSAWPWRAAIAAAIVLVIAFTGALAGIVVRSRSTPADRAVHAQAGTASAQAAGLLELLSLQQSQQANALTITGLVQNPRDGAALSKVIATALLFGPDGSFLASGRAPLDFTVLRPGDESGFVISVPVTAPVARYRVGFRSEDGRVIGHIDRRTAPTTANTGPTVPVTPRGTS